MTDNPKEKQRLLIVDDSKVIRVTARKILRDHFETLEAVDGENAWEIITGGTPVELVVSDLTMPKLDGFGLLKRIRNSHLPNIRELPVIIITGSNDSESTMERARRDGATDFIGKPFDAVHLLARTQAHANSHAVTNNLKDAATALEALTTLDPLTELPNEAAFMERGYQQLSYAIRHEGTLTLFRMEIDGYGAIHRKYGASFSDSIIRTVAKILVDAIRQEDTVARIGSARFALLLPGMNKPGVRNLAERISSSISTRLFKSGNDKTAVTVSIGVASPNIRRDMQLSELITTADGCLSRAIAGGGNQMVFDDDPVRTPAPARRTPAMRPATVTTGGNATAKPAEAPHSRKVHPFHTEGLEIEEIEITDADFSLAQFRIARDEVAQKPRPVAPASGPEANDAGRVVSGKAVFSASEPATSSKPGSPEQSRSAPTAARMRLQPVNAAERTTSETAMRAEAQEIRPSEAPPLPARDKGLSGAGVTPAGSGQIQPQDEQRAIKSAHRARRPGPLKRMLIRLGLTRSR